MGIVLGSNFDVQTALPLDSRTKVADLTARDAINALQRYEGLVVYVVSEATNFQLVGGIDNADWEELSGGGGGGAGGGLEWFASPGAEPTQETVADFRFWNFYSGFADQRLNTTFKVPAGYKPGTQIFLKLKLSSLTADAGDGYFEFTSKLLNPADFTTVWSSTDTATQTGWVESEVYEMTFEVTNASGQIGGFAVNPGDVISMGFFREQSPGTENPNDILVFRDTMEVTFS